MSGDRHNGHNLSVHPRAGTALPFWTVRMSPLYVGVYMIMLLYSTLILDFAVATIDVLVYTAFWCFTQNSLYICAWIAYILQNAFTFTHTRTNTHTHMHTHTTCETCAH